MIVDYSLVFLGLFTAILAIFIGVQNFLIGPKIGWTLTSHNTIIGALFFLQFCIYPWFYRTMNGQLESIKGDLYEKNINDGLIVSLAIFFYISYAALSIGSRRYTFKSILKINNLNLLKLNRRKLIIGYLLVYGICVTLFINFFLSFGGLEAFLLVLGSYRSGQIQGTGIYTMPILIFCPIFAIYVIDFLKSQGDDWRVIFCISLSICLPPLLVGFRVYAAIFLMQLFYIYRLEIENNKIKFFIVCVGIFFVFGIYSSFRGFLEAGGGLYGNADFEKINRFEPIFRSKSMEMIEASISCGCHPENPFGVILDPVSIIYNKLIGEEYFSYGDLFVKDVLSNGVHLTNYGGINPNFMGFFYWLFGIFGIVLALLLLVGIDFYLRNSRNIHCGSSNVFAAIVFSMIPIMFDSPVAAYANLFYSISSLLFVLLIFSSRQNNAKFK